jgi:hypothetical protein
MSGKPIGDAVAAPADLNGMSLVFGVLRARVARWFGRS